MKRRCIRTILMMSLSIGLIATHAAAQQNKKPLVDRVNILNWQMAEGHPVVMHVRVGPHGEHLPATFTADQRYKVWKTRKKARHSQNGQLPYRVMIGKQSSEQNYIKAMERATREIEQGTAQMKQLFP